MIDGIRPPRRPAAGNGMRSPDRDYLNKFAGTTQSKLPGVEPYRTPQKLSEAKDQTGQDESGIPASHHQIAASVGAAAADGEGVPPVGAEPVAAKKESFMDKLRNLDKKQWAIIIAVLVVLIGGGIAAFFMLKKDKPAQRTATPTQKQQQTATTPTSNKVTSTISGLEIDPDINNLPVTGVMIENSTDARPQSGLQEADVVFEAVAEGGITRFLALFHDKQTGYVGPVRSVRPYYIQWAMGFDAAIAHAGGSGEALNDMKLWKTKDLDQFANGGSYKRITSRYAPHNLYTSIPALHELESKKGYSSSSFTGFARKKEEPSKTPNATSIDVKISSSYFNSHYDYDATTNSYKRSQAGEAHIQIDDAGKQTQIQPKVVVTLFMTQGKADDIHSAYSTIGSGKAYIFQDGKFNEGTWKKGGNSEQFTFADNSGAPLKLNPGQTWLTAVGDTSLVTYK